MEAEPVEHRDAECLLGPLAPGAVFTGESGDRVDVRGARRRRELSGLGGQAAAGRGGHLLQGPADAGRHRGRDGALHERRLREQHASAPVLVHEVDGQLGRKDGAAQVHEDQDAVRGPGVLHGSQHLRRVRAQCAAGLVQTAGGADAHVGPGHLGGQLGDTVGELRAVADEDEADHGYVGSASVRAAVSSSSQDDVAPGSWCPALRSPR